MRLKLDLDSETTGALIRASAANLRSLPLHAEALIRLGLGLAVPLPLGREDTDGDRREESDDDTDSASPGMSIGS